jgi:hypothetical protein
MFLVLIETSGNQNFIFSTNKLRENIGASELTYLATTEMLFAAIDQVSSGKTKYLAAWQSKNTLTILDDAKTNPEIESSQQGIEILLATSGKAILLTKTEELAQAIIREITCQVIKEAPGLELGGVIVPCDLKDEPNGVAKAVEKAHKEFEKSRSKRPGANSRFLRLPIVASCSVSELPASDFDYSANGDKVAISQVSKIKRSKVNSAQSRLQAIDKGLIKNLATLEKSFEGGWLAIVHADGNGLGQILLSLEKYIIGKKTNRNYINQYRKFSLALDDCTITAFKEALNTLPKQKNDDYPVVPLILGGDDLTVICDGSYALEFTRVFLQEFEKQTKQNQDIAQIAKEVFGIGKLSACAGITVIKPHFPFSVAYDLAEKLIKSAKDVKRKVKCPSTETPFPCSAIDFHILYDSSGIDFDDIRQKLQPKKNTYLHNRPYVVTNLDELNLAEGSDWATIHHWQKFADRVDWLTQKDEKGKSCLPSSQSHAIRTALYQGQDVADGQYDLIRQRYKILEKFAERKEEKSLFRSDNSPEISYHTMFLDALDAQDFLKNAQTATVNSGGES